MMRIIITLIVILKCSVSISEPAFSDPAYPSFSDIVFDTSSMGCFVDNYFVNPLGIVSIDSSDYICLPIGKNENGAMLFFLELYYARDISYLDTFDIFLD